MFPPVGYLGISSRAFIIAVVFCVSLTVAFPTNDKHSSDVKLRNPYASDGGEGNHWKIFAIRIIQVFGVAIGVILVTTILVLLFVAGARFLYGCFFNSRRTSNKSSSSVGYHSMSRQQNGYCAGHQLMSIGLSVLVGIPCGVISGIYAWPYL